MTRPRAPAPARSSVLALRDSESCSAHAQEASIAREVDGKDVERQARIEREMDQERVDRGFGIE